MKKFVTLFISDTSGALECTAKKNAIGGMIETEIIDADPNLLPNLMKRPLKGRLGWLEWAEYQIQNWPNK